MNGKAELSEQDFIPSLQDWIIDALRYKSKQVDIQTGMEMAAPPCVYTSDSLVSNELHTGLINGMEKLINVDQHLKDWHPGVSTKIS